MSSNAHRWWLRTGARPGWAALGPGVTWHGDRGPRAAPEGKAGVCAGGQPLGEQMALLAPCLLFLFPPRSQPAELGHSCWALPRAGPGQGWLRSCSCSQRPGAGVHPGGAGELGRGLGCRGDWERLTPWHSGAATKSCGRAVKPLWVMPAAPQTPCNFCWPGAAPTMHLGWWGFRHPHSHGQLNFLEPLFSHLCRGLREPPEEGCRDGPGGFLSGCTVQTSRLRSSQRLALRDCWGLDVLGESREAAELEENEVEGGGQACSSRCCQTETAGKCWAGPGGPTAASHPGLKRPQLP